MDSNAVVFQSLVIPTGHTSGQRIVLDGVTGQIQIYDASNKLVIVLGRIPQSLELSSTDAAEVATGQVAAGIVGNGATRRLQTLLQSPNFSGIASIFQLRSDSFDATQKARARILTDELEFGGFNQNVFLITDGFGVAKPLDIQGTDLQFNSRSLGRGMPPGTSYQRLTGNDVARAAGINTDMVITPTVDNTRLYEITLKCQFNLGTLGVTYALDLSEGGTVGANDGAALDRFLRINTAESAVSPLSRTASVLYAPSTSGSKTLRVRNDAGSGGTVTLTADAGAGIGSRSLSIKDIGPQ